MTLGSNFEGPADLAALLSAGEDRRVAGASSREIHAHPSLEINRSFDPSSGANYSGGSSYSPFLPLLPSRSGLAGTYGAGQKDPVLKEVRQTKRYLRKQKGKPWPSVLNEGKVSGGVIEPTTMSFVSNINQGWNAAAQPGSPPGIEEGYKEMSLGPSTWAEALLYAPAPLTQRIGSLGMRTPKRLSSQDQARMNGLLKLAKQTDKKIARLARKVSKTKTATPDQRNQIGRLREVKKRTLVALKKISPELNIKGM